MEKYKISLIQMVQLVIELLLIILWIYGFYFTSMAHFNNKEIHLTAAQRTAMQVRLKSIEKDSESRDTKVKLIVRETIDQLKRDGYLK